jgi:hypothetical protein
LETSGCLFAIGERELAEISSYCEIAKVNKSMITLSELRQLTAADATEEDFLAAWDGNATLASRYLIDSGYIVERGGGQRSNSGWVDEEERNMRRARKNVTTAEDFSNLCASERVKLLAVAGGNSYKRARDGDDIDLFCVTTENSLWLFMLKSLLLARIYQLTRRSPPFCFSYVMDERRARTEFARSGDRLFARDALAAKVMVGAGFYRSLLGDGGWMERYFPRMYGRSYQEAGEARREAGQRRGNAAVNTLLYLTVGTYIRMKAHMLNRRYRSKGNTSALFRVRIGIDHCIYESNRYQVLRGMYNGVRAERVE